MSSLARYSRLFRLGEMRPLVLLGLVARLPMGILTIALVLFLREETGSFATAGAVVAALAVADGVFAPLKGRSVDRLGQTRLLVPLALVHAAALGTLIALGVSDASPAALLVAPAFAGAVIPPISACFRSVMVSLLEHDDELLRAGYAVDSILIELIFILGP